MPLDWAEIRPGSEGPALDLPPLTHDQFIRYAGALGEYNDVHQDRDASRAAGYPDVFAQGMLIGGIVAQQLHDWAEPARLRRYRVRFLRPAFRGDRLRIRSQVTAVSAGDTPRTAELEVEVVDQDDAILARAWTTVADVANPVSG